MSRTPKKRFARHVRAGPAGAHSRIMTQLPDPRITVLSAAARRLLPPSDDVAAALCALTDADLLRLRALARLRARALPPGGVGWPDLLQEAVLRALDGSRRWPPGVPLIAFMGGIMRSLCADHWRQCRREGTALSAAAGLMANTLEEVAESTPDHSPGSDPERSYASTQALASLDRLFADDSVALRVLAGLADDLPAAEIRLHYGLSEVEYDTARRRIRRTLLRHGLAWSCGR